MNRIIYRQLNDEYALVYPRQNLEGDEELIAFAKKEVPNGRPFWIVEAESIPETVEGKNNFVNDPERGDPDGYGLRVPPS